jgi:tetratricopeptide (TPR) repeat protein
VMDRRSGSVEVGACLLRVGNEGGTLVAQGDRGDEAEVEALRRALRRPEPRSEERAPALATEIDEAAEATSRIEQAVALCKGVSEGHALDPDQLALEVGSLLDCLERLDRKKKHRKAIQLARSLSTLLILLKRWAGLLQTLRIGLRAARELGDEATIAWAEHELGTLKLAAGDVEEAERNLRQAREIRERIGDRHGLAVTNRNLGALCERLRNMVRDEELVRRSGGRRPSFARTIALAALCVVFFGGGVAAGTIAGDDPGREPVAKERTEANDDGPSAPGNRSAEDPDGNATTPPTTTVETVPPVVETDTAPEEDLVEPSEDSVEPSEDSGGTTSPPEEPFRAPR